MFEYISSLADSVMKTARETYGVDPVVFLAIYIICGPIFYYSLFRTVSALGKRLWKAFMLWSMLFLFSTIAPFIYVIFSGRNIPWWVYGVISIIFLQSVYSLVMRIRRMPESSAAGD